MTSVLIAYAREDARRVDKLIAALKHHNLSVWSDQGLPGGEQWRANIETALRQAHCVVVVWTKRSVGADGHFVRDEATRAYARGVLVPVLLDKVTPPLGFGEIQAIDLTRWKSDPENPQMIELVDTCRTKLAAPPPALSMALRDRFVRRIAAGTGLSAFVAILWTIAGNLFGVQETLCQIPVAQPAISDTCGAIGMGDRPTRAERLAWAARTPHSCSSLRDFVARYPSGAYARTASNMLVAAKNSVASGFTPSPRSVRGYVRQSERPFSSTDAAQADARTRAAADARDITCATQADERLTGVDVTANRFDCRASPAGGQVCADDYTVTCRIERRALTETCG